MISIKTFDDFSARAFFSSPAVSDDHDIEVELCNASNPSLIFCCIYNDL